MDLKLTNIATRSIYKLLTPVLLHSMLSGHSNYMLCNSLKVTLYVEFTMSLLVFLKCECANTHKYAFTIHAVPAMLGWAQSMFAMDEQVLRI